MYFVVLFCSASLSAIVCFGVLFLRNRHAEWYRAAAFAIALATLLLLFVLACGMPDMEELRRLEWMK